MPTMGKRLGKDGSVVDEYGVLSAESTGSSGATVDGGLAFFITFLVVIIPSTARWALSLGIVRYGEINQRTLSTRRGAENLMFPWLIVF